MRPCTLCGYAVVTHETAAPSAKNQIKVPTLATPPELLGRFSDQPQRWRLHRPVFHAGRSDFTYRVRHRELCVRLGVAASPARARCLDVHPCPQAAAQPNGDTISGSCYRTWGMTNGGVWVPLRLFTDTMYPPQSSLRSSVSRPSGNANIKAPQGAPICSRPCALAPGIATSASRLRRRYASS